MRQDSGTLPLALNVTTRSDHVSRATSVFSRMAPAKPTPVFDTYWRLAAQRQEIFLARFRGEAPPWTDDPILLAHKFTNAYRASDRVSQYLIRHVQYDGDQTADEVFFRTILFKIFNRIDTWTTLVKRLDGVRFCDYTFKAYDKILTSIRESGSAIYSPAYIMPSGGRSSTYHYKHSMHLNLLEQMMGDEVPARISDMHSMREAFELLRSYPTIGDFLAYQFVTDLNYSTLTDFSEMEFVVAGPGARDGIAKCFADTGGLNEAELIQVVAEHQSSAFERLGLEFHSLWGRPLQLIDCQNLFCEVDKYARVYHPEHKGRTGRTRIKQRYKTTPEPMEYWYPPKWKINEAIAAQKDELEHLPKRI